MKSPWMVSLVKQRNHLAVCALLLAACPGSSDDAKARTREEFCQDWAKAACNDDVVSACQAEDADACDAQQEDFCRSIVPKNFADTHGDDCIDAVANAYEDGDLDATELITVRSLGAPCDQLVQGTTGEGESCAEHDDCDTTGGFDCVKKAGDSKGLCEIPEQVQPGEKCEAAQDMCTTGFFCNGKNCVAALDVGEACENPAQCGETGFCNDKHECQARFAVDKSCTDDLQCATGICYDFNGDKVCTSRIVLSRSEPICSDLR